MTENKPGRTGKADKTVRTKQHEQDHQGRIVRTRPPGNDCQTRQPEQDSMDRMGGKG
jgi:hypothetical protein